MVVQHNLTAMNSNRMLGITTKSQAKTTEQLSSGYKINRAADDAAGLAISEKMRKQIRGLTQASSNAQDGVSLVQTAEGAMAEVHDMLQRMNELAVKAANGTSTSADKGNIDDEIKQLQSEINRVSQSTDFNTMKLLNGSFCETLQVGAENVAAQQIVISIDNLAASQIGKDKINISGVTCSSANTAKAAIDTIASAIQSLSKSRSYLGAMQNRLEHTIANLDNIVENTQAAESAVRDTDMATTMVKYANNNILAQAGQAMLAQANQANQGVLSLLG